MVANMNQWHRFPPLQIHQCLQVSLNSRTRPLLRRSQRILIGRQMSQLFPLAIRSEPGVARARLLSSHLLPALGLPQAALMRTSIAIGLQSIFGSSVNAVALLSLATRLAKRAQMWL